MEEALTLEGLQAYYGLSQILCGIDARVDRGEVLALLGRNGAGKTTTFRAIMNLVTRRSGAIRIFGRDATQLQTFETARLGVGYVPADRQIFPSHTVVENLELARRAINGGGDAWTSDRVLEQFPLLKPLRNRQAGRLSGGEQQMLAIGRALLGNPSLLLLDEPSEGLAPIIVQQIADVLLLLRDSGLAMVIAEQNTKFSMRLATHVAVIHAGSTVFTGTKERFLADDDITRKYLQA